MPSPNYPKGFIPQPRTSRPKIRKRSRIPYVPILIGVVAVGAGSLSLPLILAEDVKLTQNAPLFQVKGEPETTFPISVDPATKTITEDPNIEALLVTAPTQLPASVGVFQKIFEFVSLKIASLPVYQQIAGAAGAPTLFVSIKPGQRQEQVANTFGAELHWTAAQKKEFLTASKKLQPDLSDGSSVPGIYFASVSDPKDVATLVHMRFDDQILSRYSTSSEDQVPLSEALTIASLIQRETGGWDDSRMISGIIWNRIFAGMKLQIDATLQYAEANQTGGKAGWWPSVEPKDKYIKSAYNTYQHAGLPPGPIANPSIASVLAALNPKKTDCLFYFHDSHGQFHCTKTYAEHVALLKKYYGQGK